ncbi:hypothetical protein HKX48_004722 [Thoreauomyces humboldtii]|nr:hypothetical protein HKX48_004722 [Thoreauomyces humboldtii]
MTSFNLPPPNLWLQALSLHPVLEHYSPLVDDCEGAGGVRDATLPDLSMIAAEGPGSEHILDVSSLDLGDKETVRRPIRKSLVVVHEGLVYVCLHFGSSSRIRIVNLRKWKGLMDETGDDVKEALQDADYKELRLVEVDFVVEQMELNGTGRHLALKGTKDVAIVVLPRIIWTDRVQREVISATSWRLDLTSHAEVAKVLWHHLSEKQIHLMVLTTDGVLE